VKGEHNGKRTDPGNCNSVEFSSVRAM